MTVLGRRAFRLHQGFRAHAGRTVSWNCCSVLFYQVLSMSAVCRHMKKASQHRQCLQGGKNCYFSPTHPSCCFLICSDCCCQTKYEMSGTSMRWALGSQLVADLSQFKTTMNTEARWLSAICSCAGQLSIKSIAVPRVPSSSKGVGSGPASSQTAGRHGWVQSRITQERTLSESRTGE